MQLNDTINGGFEFIAGILSWLNVWTLYKHKEVKGYNLYVWVFFTFWGFWNLYYYPSLNQWYSFFGGMSISITNITWITLVIYYKHFYRKPNECGS